MNKVKKYPLAVRIIIGSIFAIIMLVIFWQAYLLLFPHARVTFKTYRPTGYSIYNAQEVLYTSDILPGVHNFFKPQVSVRYDIMPENLYVYQTKVTGANYACSDYSLESTCVVNTTLSGRKYVFLTSINSYSNDDAGKPYIDQSAIVYFGRTSVQISSQSSMHWDKAQWDVLIDSFEQSQFPGLALRWEKPGP